MYLQNTHLDIVHPAIHLFCFKRINYKYVFNCCFTYLYNIL